MTSFSTSNGRVPFPTSNVVATGTARPFVYEPQLIRNYPIDLALAKSWMDLDQADTTFDIVINFLIPSVVACAEELTGMTFIRQRFSTFRDFFTNLFTLRRAPLLDVIEINYKSNDIVAIIDPSVYSFTKTRSSYGSIFLQEGKTWPASVDPEPDVIEIVFDAGFGDDATDIPQDFQDIRHAMLEHLTFAFTNRGDCVDIMQSMPESVRAIYKKRKILDLTISRSRG